MENFANQNPKSTKDRHLFKELIPISFEKTCLLCNTSLSVQANKLKSESSYQFTILYTCAQHTQEKRKALIEARIFFIHHSIQ